jgi:hypothetical protein
MAAGARGQPILQLENLGDVGIVALGPQVSARGGVDEPTSAAQMVRALAHTPFERIACSEVAAECFGRHPSNEG